MSLKFTAHVNQLGDESFFLKIRPLKQTRQRSDIHELMRDD